ncbi:MAG: ThuA domain-containing protein [Pirellulales bacterium]
MKLCVLFGVAVLALLANRAAATDADKATEKIRVLIVDGLNPYHDWKVTTPLMKKILEDSGRFSVDVATVPIPSDYKIDASRTPTQIDLAGFRPKFADYDVVIGNYIGPRWPKETEQDFVDFVAGGGGFVSVHSADNAFPDWAEYSRMTGVGGWYGRNEKAGPHVYLDDSGKEVTDTSPGAGGHHGPQHPYLVRIRDTEHPITRGLPSEWLHAQDELYDTLRGPAKDIHILATAYSDPQYDGTGKHEPMLMTLPYGRGRVFHTVLGHADYSMKCVGFVTTFLRGTEWAATGEVTFDVPENFPTADESRSIE